tara:strand:+ start:1925 stop:2074 length:150 start_codon:yes stop_codon:yes gene_type:complete
MTDSDKNTWVYLYGDECPEIWEHFGFNNPDKNDRLKLKFVEYQSEENVS